jgi:hypothetical protein
MRRPVNCIRHLRVRRLYSGQVQLDSSNQGLAINGMGAQGPREGAPVYSTVRSEMRPEVRSAVLGNNVMIATSGAVNPVAGLAWKIPAGSRYEDADTSGLSHYLRHAFFSVKLSPLRF